MRLGGTEQIKVDVRIVAASNIDLLTLVREGRFREDLYHRLNVIHLQLPPLRDRREDVPSCCSTFWSATARKTAKLRPVHTGALKLLMDYDWPGNVRELENVVERAVVLSTQERVDVDLLPESIRSKEIVRGVRLQLSEFLPPHARRTRFALGADQSAAVAVSDHGRDRAPHHYRHARAHRLEPDRSRRTLS